MLGKANQSLEASVTRLRARNPYRQGLTQAQCKSYNWDGHFILPDVLTAGEAAGLLEKARDVMKRCSEGGEGITRHDVSGERGKTPSPSGRVLATFEMSQYQTVPLTHATAHVVPLQRTLPTAPNGPLPAWAAASIKICHSSAL